MLKPLHFLGSVLLFGYPIQAQFRSIAISSSNTNDQVNSICQEAVSCQSVTFSNRIFTVIESNGGTIIPTPAAGVVFYSDGILSPTSNYGLDRINQNSLPLDGNVDMGIYQGDGVDIYLLDYQVDASHPDFQGRVSSLGSYRSDAGLCNDHGTAMAGVAISSSNGVAKKAKVISMAIFGCSNNFALVSDAILAIGNAMTNIHSTNRPSVLLLPFMGAKHLGLEEAIEAAYEGGIISVVSAGFGGSDACNYSPAGAPNAITVGATNIFDLILSWSNVGPCVDIFAPGDSITTTIVGGESGLFSGTSVSAAFVAGAVSQLLGKRPQLPAWSIRDQLVVKGSYNRIINGRTGTINLLLRIIVDSLCSPANETNGLMSCDKDLPTLYYYVCVWGTRFTMAVPPGTICVQSTAVSITLMNRA